MLGKRSFHCCDTPKKSSVPRPEYSVFTSPVSQKSRLGVFSPYIPKETVYSRASYNPRNKVTSEMKDRDAIIKALTKRLSTLSANDSRVSILQQQIEGVRREVEMLKNHRDTALKQRDDLLRYVTINTGRVVPIEAVKQVMMPKAQRGGIMTPIGSSEDTFEDVGEGQSVGKFSTGPMGGDADIKQQRDEGPEGSYSNYGTQTSGPEMIEQGMMAQPEMTEQDQQTYRQVVSQGTMARPRMAEQGQGTEISTGSFGTQTISPEPLENESEEEEESEEEPESESESEAEEETGYDTESDIQLYNQLRELPVWTDEDADAYMELIDRRPYLDPELAEQEQLKYSQLPLRRQYEQFNISRVKPSIMNAFLKAKGVTFNPISKGPKYKEQIMNLIRDKNLEPALRDFVLNKK